jgi:hypothetical protein
MGTEPLTKAYCFVAKVKTSCPVAPFANCGDGGKWLTLLNKNGSLEREELYSISAFYRAQERAMAIEAGEKPEWEQVDFRLFERTVILDRP